MHLTHPALEAWCTRFAAGAGTLFEWTLTEDGCLVAYLTAPQPWDNALAQCLCPLTAQIAVEDGRLFSRGKAYAAIGTLRIDVDLATLIMEGADAPQDDADPDDVALRRRLLAICRVHEQAGARPPEKEGPDAAR